MADDLLSCPLRERCAEEGRNPDEIERTASIWVAIRDDPAEARAVLEAASIANGDPLAEDDEDMYVGPPEKIADELRPIVELSFMPRDLASDPGSTVFDYRANTRHQLFLSGPLNLEGDFPQLPNTVLKLNQPQAHNISATAEDCI